MLFVTRHRVPVREAAEFAQAASVALEALAGRPGFLGGQVGRCLDEGDLWVFSTTWANVGAGRRALASGETRVALMGVMQSALDEPSAFDLALTR